MLSVTKTELLNSDLLLYDCPGWSRRGNKEKEDKNNGGKVKQEVLMSLATEEIVAV
jgi:hypothetical protein